MKNKFYYNYVANSPSWYTLMLLRETFQFIPNWVLHQSERTQVCLHQGTLIAWPRSHQDYGLWEAEAV